MALTNKVKKVVEHALQDMDKADVDSVVVAYVDRDGGCGIHCESDERDLHHIICSLLKAAIREDDDE